MNEFITKPTIQKQIDQLSKTHNSQPLKIKTLKPYQKKSHNLPNPIKIQSQSKSHINQTNKPQYFLILTW